MQAFTSDALKRVLGPVQLINTRVLLVTSRRDFSSLTSHMNTFSTAIPKVDNKINLVNLTYKSHTITISSFKNIIL